LKDPLKKTTVFISASVVILLFFTVFQLKDRDQVQQTSLESIKSLPYIDWAADEKNIDKQGVTKYISRNCFDGVNVYCSRNQSEAYLVDMSGGILHRWKKESAGAAETWQHVEMCANGDLLAIVKDRMLIRMDWDSQIKWVIHKRFHHDLALAENGDLYALARKESLIKICGFPVPILDDLLVIISPEGRIKNEISFWDILGEDIPVESHLNIMAWMNSEQFQSRLSSPQQNAEIFLTNLDPSDILHVNAVEIMDRDIVGFCKKGNLLISVLRLNLVGVIDIGLRKMTWRWGSTDLDRPHNPSLLNSNNILIFDNGFDRGYSRIVELDPVPKDIVWEYQAIPARDFFSQSRGSCQRLPNGNTLITESDRGRVFEITHSGEVVWEFYNPDIRADEKKRAPIYRMLRIANKRD